MSKYESKVNSLVKKYPDLKIPYISCGDGWFNILDTLFEELSSYPIQILQVKEKFGGLRIYYNLSDSLPKEDWDRIDTLIEQAEKSSDETCEVCGKKGQAANLKGWVKTLCEEHS